MKNDVLTPESPVALAAIIANTDAPVRVIGSGSKAGIGLPVEDGTLLVSTSKLTDVPYFEPSEFVVAAQAGVKVSDLQAKLQAHDLSLPFHHPWMDNGATLGGVIATNLGGDERLELGAPRDNVLGVEYINGRGEVLRAGGRVMKNVTGLDMGRALAGSWGRLAVLTEIAIKVVPAARMPESQFSLSQRPMLINCMSDWGGAWSRAAGMAVWHGQRPMMTHGTVMRSRKNFTVMPFGCVARVRRFNLNILGSRS